MGMFFKNRQYNVKYFDLYNWWISQQSNNTFVFLIYIARWIQGAFEIRVSVCLKTQSAPVTVSMVAKWPPLIGKIKILSVRY